MVKSTSLLLIVVAVAFFVVAQAHSEPLSMLLQNLTKEHHLNFKHDSALGESSFFGDITAITSSGTNAEAYWSFDQKKFSFQAIRSPYKEKHACDLIYTMNIDGSDITLVSGPVGRTTCSFYYPNNEDIIYGSTRAGSEYCPPNPDMSYGYLWPLNKDMDIYINYKNGTLDTLVSSDAYDAEAVVSPDGKRVIFTSAKDGDLELYTMNLDGSDERRMTYTPGYDGGAWFSWDSQMITWRANRPRGTEYADYQNLLNFGLVSPVNMQIYVQDVNLAAPAKQLTNNKGTNFAPAFLPDNSGIIFSSDLHAPNQGNFQLYVIDLEGNNLQQVTTVGNFNSFPMFSPDGTTLAFESDRGTTARGDINVLLAKWVGPGLRK
eukprot:TRINITY_DN12602_c0_g1_i1.p1 TRINITY_DN12602_c0_g1~~TRINITY_DN12602_c0_g1_i1.p1  ORF type:complete len:376 (+),score=95.17 TRINITY_DN12602_c0_g1_i1:28-1155(+)